MRDDIVLVGANLNRMLALSVALQGKSYNVTVIHAEGDALAEAARCPRHPTTMLVALGETENVVDIRALLSSMPDTRMLFLTPDHPPSAALARIVRSFGGAILPDDEADVVIVATVIAMNSTRADATNAR